MVNINQIFATATNRLVGINNNVDIDNINSKGTKI